LEIHFHCAAIAQGVSQYCCWRTTRVPHLTHCSLTYPCCSCLSSHGSHGPTRPEGSSQHLDLVDRPWSHRGGGLGPSKWWWARVGPGKARKAGMMLLWSGDPPLLQCSPLLLPSPPCCCHHPLGIPVIQSSEHQLRKGPRPSDEQAGRCRAGQRQCLGRCANQNLGPVCYLLAGGASFVGKCEA
jgi:hypothetical protein